MLLCPQPHQPHVSEALKKADCAVEALRLKVTDVKEHEETVTQWFFVQKWMTQSKREVRIEPQAQTKAERQKDRQTDE